MSYELIWAALKVNEQNAVSKKMENFCSYMNEKIDKCSDIILLKKKSHKSISRLKKPLKEIK